MKWLIFISAFFMFNVYANCENFYDQKSQELGFGTWSSPELGVEKDAEKKNRTLMSRSNVRGKKDPGPTLIMYKKEDHRKFVVLRSKDPKTRLFDRDLIYTSLDCKKINSISFSRDGLQFDIDGDFCKSLAKDHKYFEELNTRCALFKNEIFDKSNHTKSKSSVFTQ